MAQDQIILPTVVGDWTQITNSDVSGAVSFMSLGTAHYIRYTTDATKPALTARGLPYLAGTGELRKTMPELVNLVGADRIWAMPIGGTPGEVYIDHG